MSVSVAYNLLSEIAQKARDHGLAVPLEQTTQTHATGLGFDLLGQRFVATMEDVGELMRVPPTTRVPGVKNFVLGVANVRGRLMTVLDLALLFGHASKLPRGQRRVLAIEDEENLLGFVIDDSHGMQHFPADAYEEKQVVAVPEEVVPFVRGAYTIAGVKWPLLSLKAIAGDPRLDRLAVA